MTTPPFQPYLPGVVTPPIDAIEKRTKQVSRRVDELARRDLTNAIVGQGASFRATVANGGNNVLALQKGAAVYGGKQTLVLRDIAGKLTYVLDELAGYGLSHPGFNYLPGVSFAGTPSASNPSGVEQVVAEYPGIFYNPAIYASFLITTSATWSGRILATTTDGLTVSSSTVTSGLVGSQYVTKIILLPASMMGTQLVRLRFLVTPTTTATTACFPQYALGVSKALYDSAPALH